MITVEDINAKPVNLDPATKLTFTVPGSSRIGIKSPSGDDTWIDPTDWESDADKGIYVTEIVANPATISASGSLTVEVKHKDTISGNNIATATVTALHPQIKEAKYFRMNGAAKEISTSSAFYVAAKAITDTNTALTTTSFDDTAFDYDDTAADGPYSPFVTAVIASTANGIAGTVDTTSELDLAIAAALASTENDFPSCVCRR